MFNLFFLNGLLIKGWFGITAQIPTNIPLNYIGVVLTVISCFMFLFVNIEENKSKCDQKLSDNNNVQVPQGDIFDRLSKSQRRVVGVLSSVLGGFMYGLAYLPASYLLEHDKDASQNQNDYAFAMSTGIFLTSSLYFCIYCLAMKNKPKVYSKLILPSLITGYFTFKSSKRINVLIEIFLFIKDGLGALLTLAIL